MKYIFIRAHQAEFGVWAPLSRRAPDDSRQTELIRQARCDSGKVYGYRKLADGLRDQGEQVSGNRVARLASLEGILAQTSKNAAQGATFLVRGIFPLSSQDVQIFRAPQCLRLASEAASLLMLWVKARSGSRATARRSQLPVLALKLVRHWARTNGASVLTPRNLCAGRSRPRDAIVLDMSHPERIGVWQAARFTRDRPPRGSFTLILIALLHRQPHRTPAKLG